MVTILYSKISSKTGRLRYHKRSGLLPQCIAATTYRLLQFGEIPLHGVLVEDGGGRGRQVPAPLVRRALRDVLISSGHLTLPRTPPPVVVPCRNTPAKSHNNCADQR